MKKGEMLLHLPFFQALKNIRVSENPGCFEFIAVAV